ncbi:MAG: hypothetical protein U1F35_17365 [Steroidobacteraceae bacterium]
MDELNRQLSALTVLIEKAKAERDREPAGLRNLDAAQRLESQVKGLEQGRQRLRDELTRLIETDLRR